MTLSVPDENDMYPVSQSFDVLMESDDSLWTFDSEDLTDKEQLVGVPFVIVEASYRYVENTKDDGTTQSGDYVSVVGRVASDIAMKAAKTRAEKAKQFFPTIEPESYIVFNDGSTGIRRQLTGLFHQARLIDVGERTTAPEDQRNGLYDRKFYDWASALGEPTVTKDGEMRPPTINIGKSGKPLIIKVLKGLRYSSYSYEGTPTGTFYLS